MADIKPQNLRLCTILCPRSLHEFSVHICSPTLGCTQWWIADRSPRNQWAAVRRWCLQAAEKAAAKAAVKAAEAERKAAEMLLEEVEAKARAEGEARAAARARVDAAREAAASFQRQLREAAQVQSSASLAARSAAAAVVMRSFCFLQAECWQEPCCKLCNRQLCSCKIGSGPLQHRYASAATSLAKRRRCFSMESCCFCCI